MYKCLIIVICLCASFKGSAQIPYIDSKEALAAGLEYYGKGAYKKSIEEYRKIHECDTNYVTAVYELVLALIQDSSYDAAIATALHGMTLPGADKHQFMLNMASAYDYRGQPDSAIIIYDLIVNLYPHNHQAWYEKGIVYFQKKQYDVALNCFGRSLIINPNHFSSHYMTGLIFLLQGRLSEAFIALEASLLVTENSTLANKSIALLNSITSETDEVTKLYREKSEQYSHPLFDEIDQIVNSKIALGADYKLKSTLKDDIFRQSQVIIEKLRYDASDTNFVMQYYVPLLTEIFKKDVLEAFVLLKYSGFGFKSVDEAAKKQSSDVADVRKIVFPYLGKIQRTREINFVKRQKAEDRYHYYPSENVFIVGRLVTVDGEDKFVGEIETYRNNQTLSARGRNNASGKKDGQWKYFYESGKLRLREYYVNGNEADSAISYYENGNLRKIALANKKGVVDEEYEFNINGWLSERRKVISDKLIEHSSYFPNGQLEYTEKYNDKITVDGKYLIYYADGKLKKEVTYKDGKNSGPLKAWHPNGKLSVEVSYDDGKMEGPYAEYYETGVIKEKAVYKRDKVDGAFEKFDDMGRLTDRYLYSNGKLVEVNGFTPSGFLYEQIRVNSDNVPVYVKYVNTDSVVVSEQEDRKGIFRYKQFYMNGNPSADLTINESGDRNGTEIFYYPTGAKSEEANYKDGNPEGKDMTFYKTGKVKEENTYVNSKADGYSKMYFENGNVKSEGWYKEGKRQGLWKGYYPNGKIESEKYFLNDKIDGYNKDYNVNGELTDKYLYRDGEFAGHICYDTAGNRSDSVYYNPVSGNYKVAHFSGSQGVHDMEYSIKYGNLEGPFIKRYMTGNVSDIGYYKEGLRDSTFEGYYPNGKLQCRGAFKGGLKTGKWEYYDETGQLWLDEQYNVSGESEGPSRSYTCGELRVAYKYKHDQKDSAQIYYGDNNKIAFILLYEKGNFSGYTYEGKDGKLLPQVKAKNGSGHMVSYYSNGQKSGEAGFEHGIFKGKFNVYYSDGKPAEERYYNDNYERDGPVKKYSTNGQLVFEATYKDGEEMGYERNYDKNGKQLSATGYYHGVLNGPTVVEDPGNHTTHTWYYHFGRLTSASK